MNSFPISWLNYTEKTLQRPTEYFREKKKNSHGRQNASAIGDNTLTADTMPNDVGGDKK